MSDFPPPPHDDDEEALPVNSYYRSVHLSDWYRQRADNPPTDEELDAWVHDLATGRGLAL